MSVKYICVPRIYLIIHARVLSLKNDQNNVKRPFIITTFTYTARHICRDFKDHDPHTLYSQNKLECWRCLFVWFVVKTNIYIVNQLKTQREHYILSTKWFISDLKCTFCSVIMYIRVIFNKLNLSVSNVKKLKILIIFIAF